jgi:hypothetical protein
MYVQTFVKGVAGDTHGGMSWEQAQALLLRQDGIYSNWWRSLGTITNSGVARVLTDVNLDRHLHDYGNFGPQSPFISLAAGSVERDTLLGQNYLYSAEDTALEFATGSYAHAGVLFFGWVLVGDNPAVKLSSVAESVRELNIYHRWSPYQLEGEITAKVHIPANQIERVEWWDPSQSSNRIEVFDNPHYQPPAPVLNLREYF